MQQVVVTRHPGLVDYLRETGAIQDDATIVEHATPEDVRGKHVVGVLPLWLAAEAASVTEVPMAVPADARGRELTIEEVRLWAGQPVTYVVFRAAKACDQSAVDAIYRGDH